MVVNDKKIRRVQRKYQLFPIHWQNFKIATTDSDHGHKVYPNLLAEKKLTGINQAWVADITYIRILTGFVFLAAILDRYSRKVIGWRSPSGLMPSYVWRLGRSLWGHAILRPDAFITLIAGCSMPVVST